MIDTVLDNNILIRLGESISKISGFSIGIYEKNARAIWPCASFGETDVLSAINKLGINGVESVVDLSSVDGRVSAIAMRGASGDLYGIWMLLSDARGHVPFDVVLSLTETIVSTYIRSREESYNLSQSIKEKTEEGSALSDELEKNEAIAQILSKIESDDEFNQVSTEILEIVGKLIGLSNVALISFDKEDDSLDVFSEWKSEESYSYSEVIAGLSHSKLPFGNGLSYTVSTDSRMPDEFKSFLEEKKISAGIFLPIFHEEENIMYLCATMKDTPRHWELSEASFLNDTRRILSSIYAKQVAKDTLANSFAVVESVLGNIGCGVMVMEKEKGEILYTNNTFDSMFKNISDKQRFERKIINTPEDVENISEYLVEAAGVYVSITLCVIRWVDDRYVRLATIFDITKNKEIEKRIERNANIDILTGIYNRTYFVKELGSFLSSSHRPGALVCMNVEGFKEINVTSGNESGDILLSAIAKYLLKLSDENRRVYRLGGDEFAILIKDAKVYDPMEFSKSIMKRFDAPWQLTYKDCYLSTAIGIARFPEDGDDVSSVLKSGELALANAREKGRGSIAFFDKSMETKLRENILLRSFLMDSVENSCNGMELVRCPITFNITNENYPSEVLEYRWDAPELGEKVYVEYMPLARKLCVEQQIIESLILAVAKEVRYQNDFGHPEYHGGVTVEVMDIKPEFVTHVETAITKSGVNPDNLVIVIKGAVAPKKVEDLATIIESLKKLGIHVACAYPVDARSELGYDVEI